MSVDEILIVTTGGTIDKVYFDAKSDYEVGESVLDELLKHAHVSQPFFISSLMRKDSLEINDQDRVLISNTIKLATQTHIVITHGTDTMTETAGLSIRYTRQDDRVDRVVSAGKICPI